MKKINVSEFVKAVDFSISLGKLDRVDSLEYLCELLSEGKRTFYLTYVLEKYCRVVKVRFNGFPFIVENIGFFINSDSSITGKRSLTDMNVIPNTYNDHAVFTNMEDAELYADYCRKHS